jgi:hypothetical protein
MTGFNLVFFFFFDLFLTHRHLPLLILLWAPSSPMAVLMAVEAKPLGHVLSMCFFIKTVY